VLEGAERRCGEGMLGKDGKACVLYDTWREETQMSEVLDTD